MEDFLKSQTFGIVLGAIVGLLSPLILFKVQGLQRKHQLKSDIVYNVGVFFGIIKDHFTSLNLQALSHRALYFKKRGYLVEEDEALKVHLKEDVETLLKDEDKYTKRINENYTRLVKVEAKLHSLISESKHHYGGQTFISLSNLINPIVREGNNYHQNFLHQYHLLDEAQTIVIAAVISTQIVDRHHQFQHQLEALLVEINSTI